MAETSRGSAWRDRLLLLGRFLQSPRTVGAVAPSSPRLASRMVDALDLSAARVVELGPGTGSLTGAIVERLGPKSRFMAVDIEPLFIETLRQRWPHADFVCASAEQLPALAAERGLTPVDHIISGLPFASLPTTVTHGILEGIERTLRPGGTFTTFQYVLAYHMPAAVAFRREMSRRLGSEPTRRLVLGNLPPAWVLTWEKGALTGSTGSTGSSRS
jgi:phosphatidylethanolamine/phosphatidyl-N-methylethanolamine N-methyltransferase